MKKIFAFCNQKGGVGKTTSVINVATVLAELGNKTLVVDLDAQGNATSGFGLEKPVGIESTAYQLIVDKIDVRDLIKASPVENVYIIPSNHELAGAELALVNKYGREFVIKNQLDQIREEYDFILIDCPPSLGLMTVNALTASDYIIIPLQCEYYALEGLGQLMQTYQLIKRNLNRGLEIGGVILTMADFRTNLTQQVVEEVRNYFKENVFQTIIPRTVKLSEAPSFGKPAIIYDPLNKGSICYREIAKEFMKKFRGKEILEEKRESNEEIERPEIVNETAIEEQVNKNHQEGQGCGAVENAGIQQQGEVQQ